MAFWTSEGWNDAALRSLPEDWHRMPGSERRAILFHGVVAGAPPAPAICPDGGYLVPDDVAEYVRRLVDM